MILRAGKVSSRDGLRAWKAVCQWLRLAAPLEYSSTLCIIIEPHTPSYKVNEAYEFFYCVNESYIGRIVVCYIMPPPFWSTSARQAPQSSSIH